MLKLLKIKMRTAVVMLTILSMLHGVFATPATASWNSAHQYVKNVPWGKHYAKHWSVCLSPFNVILPFGTLAFFSVNMPTQLPLLPNGSITSGLGDAALSSTMVGMAIQGFVLAQTQVTASIFSFGIAAAIFAWEITALTDTCTNTFIMQPHEYVNFKNGWVTVQGKNNINPCAVSRDDVPYYFQCNNPGAYGYNKEACYGAPASGSCNCQVVGNTCSCTLPDNSTRIGTPPGYCLARSANVGAIAVGYDGPLPAHDTNGSAPFRPAQTYTLKPNDISSRSAMSKMGKILYSYFQQDPMRGGIQACVASPNTIPPVYIGCAPIAPPALPQTMPDTYYNDTRCLYVSSSRKDLISLASTLGETDSTGHSSTSVSRFLSGSMHMTSTVVGCIKDLMIKVIAIPYTVTGGSTGFLAKVQSGMQSMVYAMLSLYVALVGIKIMSSAHELRRGEYIMFLVKFALVAYFITPSSWYQVDATNTVGGTSGLFPALIFGAEQMAAFMTDALNAGDPIGMCRYQMADGTQLLTERLTSGAGAGGNITATAGYSAVKLSIWDFFDCKLLNYLNFGSCNYTFKGLMSVWMIALCMCFSVVAILLAIIMIIYCVMMVKIVFKLVSMFVLSAIIISVLVLLSPFFIACSLFSFTKGMFDTWMKKLFAYMLYPALLTGALCLILAVADAVYNGTYTGSSISILTSSSLSQSDQIVTMCAGNNGLFCKTVQRIGAPCTSSIGSITDKFTYTQQVGIKPMTYGIKALLPSVVIDYCKVLMPLMLIMVLFSSLFSSIISVVESIAGVHGLSYAHDNSFLSKMVEQAKSAAKQAVSGQASKALKGLKKYGDGDKKKRQ